MVPPRPENVIKRAEELCAVGQQAAALEALYLALKRPRGAALSVVEPIALRFVELCTDLRKGKIAREGLYDYRKVAQNTNIQSLELVVKTFLECAEKKVMEAQAKADKLTVDNIEDLEATETPESIMLSLVSSEQSKDRTDRELVTPWLKFLWEAYRTVLETLKNNSRLEQIYQETAHQAFNFCLKYTRKAEFRRLCDLLRNHLQNIAKQTTQTYQINLSDPDTLQRHLDARFTQLNAAADLELWQEAYRSVEDVHTLLTMSKRPPKPNMMTNYYEKLVRIFLVSENYLFHAAAWSRYFGLVRSKITEQTEFQRMASMVLLSALAIPVTRTLQAKGLPVDNDDLKLKSSRLSVLLAMGKTPVRAALLKDALSKGLLKAASPEIQQLYNLVEVEFHPLSICKKIVPIVEKIAQDKELSAYIQPLHQVVLTRLLQQLSQVYENIKLDYILELATFAEPFSMNAMQIEQFIMNACKKGELSIRIDHAKRAVEFQADVYGPVRLNGDATELQATPNMIIKNQASRLGRALYEAVLMVDNEYVEQKESIKAQVLEEAAEKMEEEHEEALSRKETIRRRREAVESLKSREERDLAQKRLQQAQYQEAAERERMAEDAKRRELERMKRDQQAVREAEAKKLAEELKAKGGLKVDMEKLEHLDASRLRQLQLEQLEKESKDLSEKLRIVAKRNDHLERAFRREEIPLWEREYDQQKERDLKGHEERWESLVAAATKKHSEAVELRDRLGRILPEYVKHQNRLEGRRKEEFEKRRAAAMEQLEGEKEQMREEARKKLKKERELELERQKLEREEKDRIALEEEAKKALEEKKRQELEQFKREKQAEREKLDQLARKQQQREQEVEERRRQKEQQQKQPPTSKWDKNWRERGRSGEGAAAAAATTATTTTKTTPSEEKYLPPGMRERKSGW